VGVPGVVADGLRARRVGFGGVGLVGSILPAVWSYMLAARARGLGTAWTTLHLVHEREAGELLGIPESVTQVALIPTAFYTDDTFRPGKRRPVDQVAGEAPLFDGGLHLGTWNSVIDEEISW